MEVFRKVFNVSKRLTVIFLNSPTVFDFGQNLKTYKSKAPFWNSCLLFFPMPLPQQSAFTTTPHIRRFLIAAY
jgi:hypothetical protein